MTYSVKDDSVRGIKTIDVSDVKVGDELVLDNRFVKVIEDKKMKTYRAELEDDNFVIILADNDCDAMSEYFNLADKGHDIFNLFELNDDFDVIRTVA